MEQRWRTVMFSDENRFCLRHIDRPLHFWRRNGERHAEVNVQPRHAYNGGSVNVWAGVTADRRTNFVIVPGMRVVGCGEDVVYLTSPARPTDIGLQLGKAYYQVRVEGECFLSFLFSFFPVPLFHLLYCLFNLFSPFLWEAIQNDLQELTCP